MNFESPQTVLKQAQENPESLDMHLHFQKFYLSNLDKYPSPEQADQAAAYLSKLTSIRLTGEQVVDILFWYPRARILLSVMGADEPSVYEALQFAIAHFFLRSAWPQPGEAVDPHDFTSYLRRQATSLGYVTLQGSNEFMSATDDGLEVLEVLHDEFGNEPHNEQDNWLHIPAAKEGFFHKLLKKILMRLSQLPLS